MVTTRKVKRLLLYISKTWYYIHMTKRIKKIIRSMGSVLDIYPETNYWGTVLKKTDAEKIYGDWQKVGNDIRTAMGKIAHVEKHKEIKNL